jgi:hypothetical protein
MEEKLLIDLNNYNTLYINTSEIIYNRIILLLILFRKLRNY